MGKMENLSGTVSLCMIAKNEEENIAKCLNSVKDLADEVIIADTGSTDKTKQAAEEIFKSFASSGKIFGFKLFDFKWNDDFSSARNESLKYATKDWILVLDADEVLDEKGADEIKNLINKSGKAENPASADSFLLLQKNYTADKSIAGFFNEPHSYGGKNYPGWYGSLIVRLFKNRKGFEFSGIVHELIEPSIEKKNGIIKASGAVICHYGNADLKTVRKKRQFYLGLCKKKLRENEDSLTHYEMGVLYKENDDSENAIVSLKKSVELDSKNYLSLYELGILHEKLKNYDEAIKYYTESLRIKESAESFQNLGVCYMKKGMLKESYANLIKAMLLSPNKYTIYNNLGAVFERLGNYKSAREMLEIGIKLNPDNAIGFFNLAIVYDKSGNPGEALKNYENAVGLGHKKSDEIRKRVKQLRMIIENSPNYGYSFKIG